MRLLLDGQQVNIPRPTLAAAIAAAADAARSQGRLVTNIVADGVRLTDEQVAAATDTPSTIRELACTSLDPRELVASSLRDAVGALETAARDQQSAAQQIQAGRTQDALETLGPILATWQVVQQVLDQGGTALNMDFRTVPVPGIEESRPVERCTQAVMNSLLEMKKALADEDWSAVSDIVGYDLDAHARDWRNILAGLAELVETRTGSGGTKHTGDVP
ncbi:MAG: hypothetical protein JNK25_12915 [Phycisphaerae bacterium]|nr:hypothetical protein [Phycisphaerae bacterium]